MLNHLLNEQPAHTAFIRAVDPGHARHQLRMSAGVAVVLALATAVCLVALKPALAVPESVPAIHHFSTESTVRIIPLVASERHG